MDHNGQLTFSDDPILPGINEAYQLIEAGEFQVAVTKIDALLNANPDYPGLVECYRTARFWNNRSDEIQKANEGKKKADYLMKQWDEFNKYAIDNTMLDSSAFKAVQNYVFNSASRHYTLAFKNQEATADNFNLLLKLGVCFLTLGEYKSTIDTLEYARSSHKSNALLLSLLGEAYYRLNEVPRSLLYLKEAFFINPSEIDISLLKCKPIEDLSGIVHARKPGCNDLRDWIPVFGYLEDIFYVKRKLNSQQVESTKQEIYSMEKSFQTMNRDRIENSNIIPRLITKYIWMLEYFEEQEYDFEGISDIKQRLLKLDKELFEPFFKRKEKER